MYRTRFALPLPLLLAVMAFFSVSVFGQTAATGAIVGTIVDPSGAALPSATVEARNNDTGSVRTTVSGGEGVYRFPLLGPGNYSLTVKHPGFKVLTRSKVTVDVSTTTSLDLALEIGQTNEVINVSEEAPAVQADSTTVGGLVAQETIRSLPLTTRNYTQILDLSPGVQADVPNAGTLGRNTQDVYVNGGRAIDNNFQMNGVEVNNFGTSKGGDWLGYTGVPVPNPDAIQEFNVQTALFDAGYGRGVGANVNVVTKSGTNTWHGSGFEFLRNNVLNANDFFLNENGQQRPVMRQNQFGATLGGPIVKDKAFFFVSYQGTRQLSGVGASSLESSYLPALTNDRSAAALGQIFGGQSGAYGGTAVEANGANINPVALKLLNYKLPNGTYLIPTPQVINSDGSGFSVFSVPSQFQEDQVLGNLDYNLTSKHRLNGNFFYSSDPQTASFTTSNVPGSGAKSDFQNRVANLKLTSVLSASLINEGRVSFTRNYGKLDTQTPVTNAAIGLTQPADQAIIPTIGVQGLFSIGGQSNDQFRTAVNSWQLGDQISWTHGRHNIRGGAQFERIQDNFNLPGVKRGSLLFLSFADFLLGESGTQNGSGYSNVYQSTSQAGITDRAFRVTNFSGFVQDDFKLNSHLTVNAGLRWEVFGGLTEDQGKLVNFWPSLANNDFSNGPNYSGYVVSSNFPGEPPAGVTRSSNSTCCTPATLWRNFGPRLGLAWQPLPKSNKLVVRAGYGLFYSRTTGNNALQLVVQPPYVASFSNAGPNNTDATFENPWQVSGLQPSSFPLWTPRRADSPAYIQNLAQDFRTPRTQEWTSNIQYEIAPDLVLQVGYVGTRGERLVLFRLPNQAYLASASSPVNGITENTVENAWQRVPVAGYGPDGIWQVETGGHSFYNGLQTSLNKRFRHGFQFQAAYTYSKTLDDVPIAAPILSSSGTSFNSVWGGVLSSDQRNRRASWGPSDFDRTHRFVFSYNWQLPGLHSGARALKAVANGWQLSGVTTIQSGNALSVYDPSSGTIYGLYFERAQLANGFQGMAGTSGSTTSRLKNWINANAFGLPPAIGDGYAYGNSPRGIVRGPGQQNFDVAASKLIPLKFLREGASSEFRAEFFNIFNHAQFADPATTLGSANFGTITSTAVTPRLVQLALKVTF